MLLAPGSTCILVNLTAQQFNDHKVVIVEYMPDDSRYRVRPLNDGSPLPPTMAIKAENLFPFEPTSKRKQGLRRLRLKGFRPKSERHQRPKRNESLLMHQRQSTSLPNVMAPSYECPPHSNAMPSDPKTASRSASLPVLDIHVPSETSESSNTIDLKAGSKARLVGLQAQPSLNGQFVSVLEFVPQQQRYRVRNDTTDQSMLIKPSNLRSQEENEDAQSDKAEHLVDEWQDSRNTGKILPPGSRAVTVDFAVTSPLHGEVVSIVEYAPTSKSYIVRLHGKDAVRANNGNRQMIVPRDNLKPAPGSAFWARLTIQGRPWRVPASCRLDHNSRTLRVVVEPALVGLDRTIPVAKAMLGANCCDWINDAEALEVFESKPSPPLTVPIGEQDAMMEEGEVLVDPTVAKTNPFFRALLEYRLIQRTNVRIPKAGFEVLEVYKLCFTPQTMGAKKESVSVASANESIYQMSVVGPDAQGPSDKETITPVHKGNRQDIGPAKPPNMVSSTPRPDPPGNRSNSAERRRKKKKMPSRPESRSSRDEVPKSPHKGRKKKTSSSKGRTKSTEAATRSWNAHCSYQVDETTRATFVAA